MKVLQIVTIPHKTFNEAVRDGSVEVKMNSILESIKPEVVYFTEHRGKRGAILVVDIADPSKIPVLAEPWFLTFDADVHFQVAMTADDLKKAGLKELGKRWA